VTSYRRVSKGFTVAGAVIVAVLVVPLFGLLVRVPWSRIGDLFSNDSALQALRISAQTSVVATVICVVFGVPVAWVMAQQSSALWTLIRAVVTVPIILPPVVGGIALLAALGRRGVFGQWLFDWFGVSLPFTQPAVVVAQVFVAMPFLVLTAESAFRQMDKGIIDAARVMGCSPLRTFLVVALPAARPAIVAGVVLAWARAIGEFGASISFAGSLSGRTQTVPMAVYALLDRDWELAMLLSVAMMILAIGIIVALRKRLVGAVVS
jgi:molybdate transport system permease protein